MPGLMMIIKCLYLKKTILVGMWSNAQGKQRGQWEVNTFHLHQGTAARFPSLFLSFSRMLPACLFQSDFCCQDEGDKTEKCWITAGGRRTRTGK